MRSYMQLGFIVLAQSGQDVPLSVCSECGAVVSVTATHDAWHQRYLKDVGAVDDTRTQ